MDDVEKLNHDPRWNNVINRACINRRIFSKQRKNSLQLMSDIVFFFLPYDRVRWMLFLVCAFFIPSRSYFLCCKIN